ncbi:MAG: serine hydrolase [Candidatus Marinimicrobia bacterium]|nr:serine hydrolase [Candidatus Neomarinimicrobiota bacterium]
MPKSSKNWPKRVLKKLSLREKIAQMMIYRMHLKYESVTPEKWEEITRLVSGDGIGGIHLWSGDGSSSLAFINEIQNRSKVPIIFDADIERGFGQRFPSGTDFPPMMAITATGNPKNAYDVGKIVAIESKAAGVQWNLSPVVDVNNNPLNPIINTRSFSEDPDIVSEFSLEYTKGLQDHGMIATAKHFPGHGDTQTDSHSSLAIIPSDSSRLWSVELKPFRVMAGAGIDVVMMAHIHAPDYQPEADEPATLSRFWVTEILRERLGFDGAIITDAMSMGGITKNYSDDYAIVKAIQAGCNIIIQNYDLTGAIDVVEKAVTEGDISIDQINSSALKMLQLKDKVGLNLNRYISMDSMMENISTKENRETASRIASESITLVRDKKGLLPLSANGKDTLYVFDIYDQEYKHSRSTVTTKIIAERFPVSSVQIDESDKKPVLDAIIKSIPKNSQILINAFVSPKEWKDRIFFPDNETYFVRELLKKSDRIILASLGTPYLLQDFSEVSTYLCAYKGSSIMQNALADALLGLKDISGRLPVTIPNLNEIGSGMFKEKKIEIEEISEYTPGTQVKRVLPRAVGVDNSYLESFMESAIEDSAWPGGVLLAAKGGNIFYHQGHGFHTYARNHPVRSSDIFDLASITKVIATTSAIMRLVDQNKINIDKPVMTYLPDFKGKKKKYKKQKSTITVKDLLSHSSGLPAFKQYYQMKKSKDLILGSIYDTEPVRMIGDTMIYSDVGAIMLGELVEKVSDLSLNKFTDSLVFEPLGMTTTFFNPPKEKIHRIIPTEIDPNGNLIHGYVHDENAHSLGGVAGHAGLFSTAKDLAIFSQMMLNKGIYGWKRIFRQNTVELFTTRADMIPGSSRCLGWDSPSGASSGGVYLSDASFGHGGYTGTTLWIDPENEIIVILLTNAVHPNRKNKEPKYFDWRHRIHSAVYESLSLNEKNPSLELRPRWINSK